jgi:hypothetical protein
VTLAASLEAAADTSAQAVALPISFLGRAESWPEHRPDTITKVVHALTSSVQRLLSKGDRTRLSRM